MHTLTRMSARTVSASDFKATCLGLLDEIRDSGLEVIITKRGKPVARLVPIGRQRRSLRGAWKGLARIRGDIVHVDWSAAFEANR
jgi:prevent-host-death family protein